MGTLIIGKGRTGRHFQNYLSLLGIETLTWARSEHPEADIQNSLLEQLDKSSRVILAISDSAISTFFHEHLKDYVTRNPRLSGKIFHLSGSVVIPEVHGFHPLMTFGPELYNLELYQNINFVTCSEVPLREILPELPNNCYALTKDKMKLYHALCVASGNITAYILTEVFKEFEKLQLPSHILKLYMEKTLANTFSNGMGSLTGPAVRKDIAVCQAHLNELASSKLKSIYQAYVTSINPEWTNENSSL